MPKEGDVSAHELEKEAHVPQPVAVSEKAYHEAEDGGVGDNCEGGLDNHNDHDEELGGSQCDSNKAVHDASHGDNHPESGGDDVPKISGNSALESGGKIAPVSDCDRDDVRASGLATVPKDV